ncbi:hypothetical protein FA95DRAFT_1286031 [Auriscalpium vulgare]|uniref:Uncharacterized protein n=1 Tax=Auriscalpium vulgare TaxID=40419 RepID=A0ACB8R2P5_9AGAM|nr:hypothetical protein FA95DRAFT_1286031 [Auriscalpium vulgare]
MSSRVKTKIASTAHGKGMRSPARSQSSDGHLRRPLSSSTFFAGAILVSGELYTPFAQQILSLQHRSQACLRHYVTSPASPPHSGDLRKRRRYSVAAILILETISSTWGWTKTG